MDSELPELFLTTKTRLPEGKSLADELAFGIEMLVDQRGVLPLLSTTTRFPFAAILKMPAVFVSGISLLATQTTVCFETLLNHIPMYRLGELPGLKKPSLKFPLEDMRDSFLLS